MQHAAQQDDGLSLTGVDVDTVLAAAQAALGGPNGRVTLDPDHLERDLVKLVLVIAELLRRLMEHQALERMDRGTLTETQIDALGDALSRAQLKIAEMRDCFGIAEDDFNIDLGPLGTLL